MQSTKARRTLMIALPLTLALGFAGGAAFAADARLDQADAHVDQAIALLTAADNPNRREPKFGGHRFKAIQHLKTVKREIAAAKEFADRPGPRPRPSSGPPTAPAPTTPPKERPGPGSGKDVGPKGPKEPSPGSGPKGPKEPGATPGKGPSPTPSTGPKTKG